MGGKEGVEWRVTEIERERQKQGGREREKVREALREAEHCHICDSVVIPLVPRTIMGPHGISRAVQRLEFSDCRKGLGECRTPDRVEKCRLLSLKLCLRLLVRCEDHRRLP